VAWLKDHKSSDSFSNKILRFYDAQNVDFNAVRMPILHFYVTDPEVVKKRIIKRMGESPEAADRDYDKIKSPEAWAKQIEKEPVTIFPELALYSDICLIDMTGEYVGENRQRIRTQIKDFLGKNVSMKDTGILKGESLEQTLARVRLI
jgi:hypothetical protein